MAERVGDHPHVVRFMDAAVLTEASVSRMLLIYEYAGVSLFSCLQGRGFAPTTSFVQACLRQVAR